MRGNENIIDKSINKDILYTPPSISEKPEDVVEQQDPPKVKLGSPDDPLPKIGTGKTFGMGYGQEISKNIEEVGKYRKEIEEIKANVEAAYGTEYLMSIDDKRKKILEIDSEIAGIKNEIESIAEEYDQKRKNADLSTPGLAHDLDREQRKLISQRTNEMAYLMMNKKDLESQVSPVTPAEIRQIKQSGFGIYGRITPVAGVGENQMSADLIKKYGKDRIMSVYNESVKKDIDLFQRQMYENQASKTTPDPNTILSWNNLQYGKAKELTGISDKELDSLWKGINLASGFWGRGNTVDDKKKIISNEVKAYLSGKEIEDRNAAYESIMSHLLPKLAFNDDGSLSTEGIKLFGSWTAERAKILQEQLLISDSFDLVSGNYPQAQFMSNESYQKLSAKYGSENVNEWMNIQSRDRFALYHANRLLTELSNMPEQRGGFRDIGKAAIQTAGDFTRYATLGVLEATDKAYLEGIITKAGKGEALTPGEDLFLTTWATLNHMHSAGKQGTTYQVAGGVINMMPYILQFAATTPGYAAAHSATLKRVAPAARDFMARRLGNKVADFTALQIARAAGVLTQAAMLPQMTAINALENMRDEVVLTDNMGELTNKVYANSGDPTGKAILKGFSSTVFEMGWERAGDIIMKTPNAIGKYASKKYTERTGKNLAQGKFIDNYMKLKGIVGIDDMMKHVDKHHLGWHGVFEEYFEELGTYVSEKLVDGENPFGENFGRDQYITFLTVATFGGFMGATKTLRSYIVGPDVKYDVRGQDGKIKSYKMPFHMHKEFMSILNNESAFFDEKRLEEFYSKYSEQLKDEDLSKLTILLTADIGSQKATWYARRQAAAKNKKEPVPGFDPYLIDDTKEAERPNLDEEDKAAIERENKRILKEHAELAENNLLLMDEATGQYLEPTKEVIDELYGQTLNEYKSKADIDVNNVLLNRTEVEGIKKQLDILEKYRIKQIDQTTPWANLKPLQKQQRLIAEIKAGEKMRGSMSYITDRAFQVKLRDGRIVKAYYDPNLSKEEHKKVRDAILNNEEVDVVHQGTLDWNSDLMITDSRGVPYYDRAAIKLGDKIIGAVEVTDYRAENVNEKKEKKKREEVERSIADAANKAITIIPKAEPVVEQVKKDEEIAEETEPPAQPKYSIEDRLRQQAHQGQLDRIKMSQDREVAALQRQYTKGKDVISYLENLHDRVAESELRIKALSDSGNSTVNAEKYKRRLESEIEKISSKFNDITERHGNAIERLNSTGPGMAPTQAEVFKLQESKAGLDYEYNEHYTEALDFLTEFMAINGFEYEIDYSHSAVADKVGSSQSPVIKEIRRKFGTFLGGLNTSVTFRETTEEKAKGEYDIRNNRIIISIQRMAQDYANRMMVYPNRTNILDILQTTFMHEQFHAFTALKVRGFEHRIDTEPRARKLFDAIPLEQYEIDAISRLNDLYMSLKDKNPEDDRYVNLQEFIAYSQTDIDMINYLKSTYITRDGKKVSAFQRLWYDFLRFLGFNPGNTTHDYASKLIYDVAALYVPSDAFENAYKYDDIIEMFEALNGNMYSGDRLFIENQITPENRDIAYQNFLDSILDQTDKIEPGEEIRIIKKGIELASYPSEEDKGQLTVLVNNNEDNIIRMITERRAANKGWIQRYKAPSINDLVIEEPTEGVNPTGAQKVAAMLKSFSPLWSQIATALNVSRDEVERKFYVIAKQPEVIGNLQNESIYQEFVASLYGKDNITDSIADALKDASLNNAVSLFDFYSNISLTRQYKLVVRGNEISRVLLNPSQRYEEFLNSFWSAVTRYQYKGLTGFEAIQRKLKDHTAYKTQTRFNERNWTSYLEKPEEEKERLRREQHQEDLVMLSEVTGIPIKLWEQYFKQQTRETFARPNKDSDNDVDYTTYDNLLSHTTWRKGTTNTYPRIESNLAFQLRHQLKNLEDIEAFKAGFIKFFTVGTEDGKTLSNLYKLSTAIESKDEIGLRGFDVKGDSFSSFVQNSHLQSAAHSIRNSWAENHITKYYREQGEDAEIVYMNGIQLSESESDYEGFDAINISSRDLWTMQLQLFLEEGDTYLHWLGQFGDKPALHFMKVPKFQSITDKQLDATRKKFKGFDEAVDMFVDKIIQPGSLLLDKYFPFTQKADELRAYKRRLAEEFLFNFAANIKASSNIFFGEINNYKKGFVEMVKRAGSANSPGYQLNPYVEGGVGKTFRFALVDDRFKGSEIFDGMEFMSGDYAKRMQVSMGSKFSKDQLTEFNILDSAKVLTSLVNNKGRRGLTKTNRLNIDALADAFPKSMYSELRYFMRKNQIDVLSFGSGTKMYEEEGGKTPNQIKLWNEDGTLNKKPEIPEFGITTRNNSDVFVQQDLRHSSIPKTTPLPAQMHANMMVLGSGSRISSYINRLQEIVLNDFIKTFEGKDLSQIKIEWLLENINKELNPDIFQMLSSGSTVYEPALLNYFKKLIAGHVERKALELPINRVTTQEIADPGISSGRPLLLGRRHVTYNGRDYIALPEIAANIEGARYDDETYKGKPAEAVQHVIDNRDQYVDLFDQQTGELNEWEIYSKNGVIPGEIIISTRVPADDLHSHTVGRLKKRIDNGNFTMLDEESRIASGADSDGDQRYNQVFYRDKNGKIIEGNTREAIANNIMRAIALDYTNPEYDERIRRPIDTVKYKNDIVKKYQQGRNEDLLDWRAHDMARNENMNGVKMKGILTDAVTIYGLLSPRRVRFKEQISLPVGDKYINLSGFAKDPHGLLKSHLTNFLNLAFDNANDPQLESIGFNEITSNMWVMALLGDSKLDTTNEKAIMERIADLAEFFRSEDMDRFVSNVREAKGALSTIDEFEAISRFRGDEMTATEMTKLITNLYYRSNEFPKLRMFYSLTQNMPATATDYIYSQILYNHIASNDKKAFKFIDVKPLFEVSNGVYGPVTEFASATKALQIAKDIIHKDGFMMSSVGSQILARIRGFAEIKEGKEIMYNDLAQIERMMNRAAIIKAVSGQYNPRAIEVELVKALPKLKETLPENRFLQVLHLMPLRGRMTVGIDPNLRHGRISEKATAEIQSAFNELYLSEDNSLKEIATKFAIHTLNKYGVTTTNNRGGYYNLISVDARVDFSNDIANELDRWTNDGLSSIEKMEVFGNIMRSVYPKIFTLDKFPRTIRVKSPIAELSGSTGLKHVNSEALEDLTTAATPESYMNVAAAYDIDHRTLTSFLQAQYGFTGRSMSQDIIPAIKRFLAESSAGRITQEYRESAEKNFPPITPQLPGGPKAMLPSDAIHEALATDDMALQDFIFQRLNDKYPGIMFFDNREEFMMFVESRGGSGYDVSLHAIGLAFENAVLIDTNKAVQSTQIHEYAHIYWDALPKGHEVKAGILNFYKEQYPGLNDAQLEEQIILDIGRAGTDLAGIMFRGNILQRFLEHLKAFWRAVKIYVVGNATKEDLVRQLAWDIWQNSDMIHSKYDITHSNIISTNEGSYQVKNMIVPNHENEAPLTFTNETHTYTLAGEIIPSTSSVLDTFVADPFNADQSAMAFVKSYQRKLEVLTKYRFTENDTAEHVEAVKRHWTEGNAESGTAVHAVFEAVLNTKTASPRHLNIPDEIRSKFTGDTLRETILMAEEFWKDVLNVYPDAVPYSEMVLASRKTKIGGMSDLVVDTGNVDKDGNHILAVYDFKLVKQELADDFGPLSSYKTPRGLYRAPFQNLANSKYTRHMLQTNIYSNMLEEIKDSETGIGNIVEEIRIIPIVGTITSDNKVGSVMMGKWVKMPRTDKTKEISSQMMELSYSQRRDLEEIFDKYSKVLAEQKVPIKVRTDMLKAMHFISMIAGDPRLITKTHVDNIRHLGLRSTYAFLVSEYLEDEKGNMMDNSGLGYTQRDIYGTTDSAPMTAEELFFVAVTKTPRHKYFGYTKQTEDGEIITYAGSRDETFVNVPVYERYKAVKNPNAKKGKYHRYKDRIIQDVGIDNVRRGDELFMIYDVPGVAGGRDQRITMYTVLEIMPERRIVKVRTQDTYEETEIYVPGNYTGLHKLHQELPKGIEDPGPDSFVPAFTYEIETVEERHWKIDIGKDEYESRESKGFVKKKNLEYMRRFFGQFSTWAEMENYFSDEVNVQNLWERINAWDDKVFGDFKRFVRDDLVNHWMASGVKNEYGQFSGTVPPHILPQTLNMYYIATRDPNALWVDFDHGWNGVRMNMPARFHHMKHAPFLMMTKQIYESVKTFNEVAYDLDKKLEKFDDMDLAFDIMMYEKGNQKFWRHPQNVDKVLYPNEHEFLRVIYDYYIKYDPSMADVKSTGTIRLIPTAQIHGKAEEFIRAYGKRFGRTMFEKLKPSRYDSIRLRIVQSFEDGQPVYAKDTETGQPIVRTLGEIKAEFIDKIGSEEEKKKFLGRRFRHIFMKIPGALTTFGKTKSGMLNWYIIQADKIVSQGGDQYNDSSSVTRSGKRISIVGKGKVLLPTKYYIAAESEAITSMIKAFYLRKNMAPLDWMLEMYSEEGNGSDLKLIGRWLKNWGEYQLYQKKPDEALMRSRIWHDLVDWATKINSLNKIAFSATTQVNNLLIGQSLDIIREPGAFTVGWKRLHGGYLKGENSIKKGFNILQRHGVANVVSESVFDQLDKQYRLLSVAGVDINMEDIENLGYWPMDKVEKMNQAAVFIGLMTQEEWDAYDTNGNIKDPAAFKHLSSFRSMVLANMVQDIHGDYGTLAAAPAWLTAGGKAIWQFKKWLPTMVWFHIAPYHIDGNYQIKSGMFATVKLMSKILYYNNVTVRKQQEALQKKLEAWEKDPESAPRNQFIESVTTYFNALVEEANGGRIKYRQLSENESRNLRQLTGEMALVATRILLLLTIWSGNDDKTFAKDAKKIFTNILDRWYGDVLWVYNWDNWNYAFENLIPALQLLVAFTQTINDVSNLVMGNPEAFYQKDANLASEGFPKAVISATYWLPGGSAARQFIQFGRKQYFKHTDYADFMMKLGLDLDAETLMEMSNISVWDAKEQQREYQATVRDINDALLYLQLENAGINPEQYYETLSHMANVKKFIERYGEANANVLLQQLMEQDGITYGEGYTLSAKDIKKWASKGRKAKKDGQTGTLKEKSRSFQKNSIDLR